MRRRNLTRQLLQCVSCTTTEPWQSQHFSSRARHHRKWPWFVARWYVLSSLKMRWFVTLFMPILRHRILLLLADCRISNWRLVPLSHRIRVVFSFSRQRPLHRPGLLPVLACFSDWAALLLGLVWLRSWRNTTFLKSYEVATRKCWKSKRNWRRVWPNWKNRKSGNSWATIYWDQHELEKLIFQNAFETER